MARTFEFRVGGIGCWVEGVLVTGTLIRTETGFALGNLRYCKVFGQVYGEDGIPQHRELVIDLEAPEDA